MDHIEYFFQKDCKRIFLNRSHTRSLQVLLVSLDSEVKLVVRLTAHDHNNYIDFTYNSWKDVTKKAQVIKKNMRDETERTIFVSEDIKVFTEMRHDKCAICFMDSNSNRVNMMLNTFNQMIEVSYEIDSSCSENYKKIKNTAQKLKSLIAFMTQNEDEKKNTSTVNDILDKLSSIPDTITGISTIKKHEDYENSDNESCDEYEYMYEEETSWCNRKCHRCCNRVY